MVLKSKGKLSKCTMYTPCKLMKPNFTVFIPACELRMDSRTVDVLARKREVEIRKKTGKQELH